jgi:hypothetical protein
VRPDLHHERRRSDQKLVSTGKGRTTCGYFLADGKHIVYASTHEAAMPVRRRRTAVRATCGPYFPATKSTSPATMAAFKKKLTDAPGYDAEATVNWKTGKMSTLRSLREIWICGR